MQAVVDAQNELVAAAGALDRVGIGMATVKLLSALSDPPTFPFPRFFVSEAHEAAERGKWGAAADVVLRAVADSVKAAMLAVKPVTEALCKASWSTLKRKRPDEEECSVEYVFREVLEVVMQLHRCAVFCSDRPVVLDPECNDMHPVVWQTLKPALDDAHDPGSALYALSHMLYKPLVACHVPPLDHSGADTPPLFDMRTLAADLKLDCVFVANEPVSLRSASFGWPGVYRGNDKKIELTDAEMAMCALREAAVTFVDTDSEKQQATKRFDAANGKWFSVRDLLLAVADFELVARNASGRVNINKVFFEGVHRLENGTFEVCFGS